MSNTAAPPRAKFPEAIVLAPGDTVEGEFVRLERGVTRRGEKRHIAVLSVAGEPRSLWLHEKALAAQFAQLQPEPGERVVIRKGDAKVQSSSSGFWYWPVKAQCPDREAKPPTWEELADSGDDSGPLPPPEPEPDRLGDQFGDDIPF